ncbi:MAG TPA: alkaline phosphatase family protein [Terriglobales bacterium]|jgi:phospholipase C|nr:alkaline phosphatase family protein [Terriglobales bacterium]
MKLAPKSLLLLIALAATTTTFAQTIPAGTFKHIIIIVMENRTPDNIFGSQPGKSVVCGTENPFEPGVDIENGGNIARYAHNPVCLTPVDITGESGKYDHTFPGWRSDYDAAAMDGFCHQYNNTLPCPPMSYIPMSEVQPYFDIATSYGFANYMFQSNEGPSFPAHQFLFGGTSAPVAPGKTNFDWFVAENGGAYQNGMGCPTTSFHPQWIDPGRNENIENGQPMCYDHPTLVDQLTATGTTWRNYIPKLGTIWDAPEAIKALCFPIQNGQCAGQPFVPPACNIVWPGGPCSLSSTSMSLIINDINACSLRQVSWVIPDEAASDHPGNKGLGPSFVANIVDAVGNSYTKTGGKCDYWGYGNNSSNPEPTAIFVTWDDWGGFYDHVKPWALYTGHQNQVPQWVCTNQDAPNGWGCGYTAGFRVPLLVLSEYTKAGYVSGACDSTGCNNNKFPYQHDFGSILRFTERNFGMQPIDLADKGYADYNAPDNQQGNVPLSDFFSLNWQRTFIQIIPLSGQDSSLFLNYYGNPTYGSPTPQGPDGGPDDD